MSVKKVIKMGNPILRQVSTDFTVEEILSQQTHQLLEDLFDTMISEGGIGIAAPQIGISKSVALIKLDKSNPRYNIEHDIELLKIFNPKITILDDTLQTFFEGCLSVPGLRGEVSRPRSIKIDYLDELAQAKSIIANDFLATVFQHELDHLIGKLYVDRMTDITKLYFQDEMV